MRVIAGTWKGRRLKSPPGDGVRPTTDRVKEAMFSILGSDILDCLFLDLCCGAGGLGIEALSRGATRCVFLDRSAKALDLVRDNLASCGAEKDQFQLVQADVTRWWSRWRPDPADRPWVVVADPPYRSEVAGAIMRGLERLAEYQGFRAAVVEHGLETTGLPGKPLGGLPWQIRRYGESILAVVRPVVPGSGKGE
jgi:16S rRNA (guanine966-N2)-methyltransferase